MKPSKYLCQIEANLKLQTPSNLLKEILTSAVHQYMQLMKRNRVIEFINKFNSAYGIRLDPVYTGEMMYGIFDLARDGFIKTHTRILAIHTGGQQGIAGFNQRFGNIIE